MPTQKSGTLVSAKDISEAKQREIEQNLETERQLVTRMDSMPKRDVVSVRPQDGSSLA